MAPTAYSSKEIRTATNGKPHVGASKAANGHGPEPMTQPVHLTSAEVIDLEHEYGAHK